MTERLEKLNLVKGLKWERQDPLDNIGVPTYELIKDAIQEKKFDLAKDLIDYVYFWELKTVRDAGCDLAGGFPQFIMASYGEEGFYQVYRELLTRARGFTSWPIPPVGKHEMTPFDYTMQHALWMVRPHRMGKNDGTGGFVLEEYDDRYEVLWDPCYTGGRTRRGDPNSGTPAHTQPPFNYVTNKVPHVWTWGKTEVTGYCTHCALLHERLDTEQTGGYLGQWVTGYPQNPWDPCRYIAYKDLDWIPEKYYARLGLVKPKPTSKKPAPKNPRLLKVTHSHDLGPFWKVTDGEHWMNTVPRIKKAIDAKDTKKAMWLVDMLNAETFLWTGHYPIRWNWVLMDLIVEKYGYNELYHALRSIYSRMEPPLSPDDPIPAKAGIPGAEVRVKKAAAWGRGDLSGPNHEGSVKIINEPDRIVMELNPCGRIGRALMNVEKKSDITEAAAKELLLEQRLKATKPLTEDPYNLKVTDKAHPVAWNKVGVPHICARCCVHFEMDAITRNGGYLTTIVERSENAKDTNCRWFFYKDLDSIPEKYYERIGARKPTPRA